MPTLLLFLNQLSKMLKIWRQIHQPYLMFTVLFKTTTLNCKISTMVNSLTQVIGILITVSILLAVVVLYNLTNINVSERIHELSTVKVLGFYNNEVSLYIYRETIYLSIIGIFVGFGLGQALHQYMVKHHSARSYHV